MSEEPGSPERSIAHPSLELAVLQRSAAWDGPRPALERRFPLAAEAALSAAGRVSSGPSELNLVLADDAFQQNLNRTYRGIDKSTNVLAFAGLAGEESVATDGPAILGDVVLAFETCAAEAEAQGKRLDDHALHLALHGLLHLLGFSHNGADDARTMEELERRILSIFDIADPYAERTGSGAAGPKAHTSATRASEMRTDADG